MKNEEKLQRKIDDLAECMSDILDVLKLYDYNYYPLKLTEETLSEMMFRKMWAHDIDLNKLLGFKHLKPVEYETLGNNNNKV